MLSIKPLRIYLFSSLLVLLLVGCIGKERMPEDHPVAITTSVQEQPQESTGVQQSGSQANPATQLAGPPVVVESEAEIRERIRLQQLAQFGPDPYLARAPLVPEQAKADFFAAIEILNAGDTVTAEAEFMKLVDSYPTLSGPAYNLAVIKAGKGDHKAALEYIEIALSRNYYNLHARALKAYLCRETGDFALAEKEYLEIVQLWGGFLPAYKNLGILYDLYMGRIEDALGYYKKYNALLAEPDKQVLGWSVDIERQLVEKQSKNAAAAEAEAIEAAAVAGSVTATNEGAVSENPPVGQSRPNGGGQEIQ